MRNWIAIGVVAVGAAGVACAAQDRATTGPASRPSPERTMNDGDDQPFSMDALRGKARPVLVFMNPDAAGEGEGAQYGFAHQMAVLNGSSSGLAERDIVVIGVKPDGATLYRVATAEEARDDPDVREQGLVVDRELGKSVADELRTKYDAAGEPLVVVLVGKDGGEKLRDTNGLEAGKLFETIDAMPMRRREMRE